MQHSRPTTHKRGEGMGKKVVTRNECYQRILSEPADYSEWLKSASRKQKALLKKIYSMEIKLFGDLLFEEPLEEDLLDPDNAPLMSFDDEGELPLDEIRISFEPNFESEGIYWGKLQYMVLKSEKPFNAVIHEVLHAYEAYYERRTPLHGFWTIRLYSRLLSKVSNLDKICTEFVMTGLFDCDTDMGDTHSMLFLLKSLDLDLRLDIPLGTTFGYGLARYISELNKREDAP